MFFQFRLLEWIIFFLFSLLFFCVVFFLKKYNRLKMVNPWFLSDITGTIWFLIIVVWCFFDSIYKIEYFVVGICVLWLFCLNPKFLRNRVGWIDQMTFSGLFWLLFLESTDTIIRNIF